MAHHDASNGPSFDDLHPAIYKALAGCGLWMVIAAWIFFGGQGYASFVLTVVTGLFVMAAALPFLLWRTWRKSAGSAADRKPTFSQWWRGEVDTWQGRVESWDAAIEVLLPLGIAAIGMTGIGLIFRLVGG
jgi:uncharacterized membrane protein YjgN (DUF898 family)